MNFLEPNIVVVDDKRNEVEGIISYYNDQGFGCKYFNSDLIEGDIYPNNNYTDVNLFFLDLIYSEQQAFDPELCASWVRSIIPEKSYYILILWTKDPSKAEEVLKLLKHHNRTPYLYLVESKTKYPANGNYSYDKLLRTINSKLDLVPALEEIQIWKKSVKRSSNEVLGNLTKDSDPILFNSKLKKIIISHGGTFIKSSSNDMRKRTILFDALDNILISNTKKNIVDDDISNLNKENLYKLDELDFSVDKELNSWFHFKLEKNLTKDLICPGLISYNNHSLFKKLYSIQDDPKVEKILAKQKEGNIIIKDIVLVLSRPCDIAQNKFGKNIKLLSGIIIKNSLRHPDNHKKRPGEIHFNDCILPDSIKKFEHLYFDQIDDDITLLFDFRYSFSVPEKIFIEKFENVKVFNKELLSEMQVEYSSYSSRLGITQII